MMMAWLCVLVKGGNVPGPLTSGNRGDALAVLTDLRATSILDAHEHFMLT